MEAGETGADTFDDLIADNTVDFEERSDMFGVTVIDGVDFDDESVSFLAVVGGPIYSHQTVNNIKSKKIQKARKNWANLPLLLGL